MRKHILAIVTVAILLPLGAVASDGIFSSRLKGNGNKIIENRQSAMQFTKVSVYNGIHLIVSDRRDGDILIRTDENIMPYVKMEVRNGAFRAWLDNASSRDMESIRVDIEMPYNGQINEIYASAASSVTVVPLLEANEVDLSASGASSIVANVRAEELEIELSGASAAKVTATANDLDLTASGASKLTLTSTNCKECDIDVSGASKVTGAIIANKCDVDISGASKVELSGSARQAEFEITGASKLNATEFITEFCTVSASGASAAYVHCTKTLSAEANGSSKVGYKGDCRLNLASDSIFKQN